MKDKENIIKHLKKYRETYIAFGLALICLMFAISLYEAITYEPSKPFNWTWEGILMFMGICAGIGWVIHGTGFLFVKVSR